MKLQAGVIYVTRDGDTTALCPTSQPEFLICPKTYMLYGTQGDADSLRVWPLTGEDHPRDIIGIVSEANTVH